MLSIGTGWDVHKLDADMQRPLYMRPKVRRLGAARGLTLGRQGARCVAGSQRKPRDAGGRPVARPE
jgi:hypothetical protein